MDPLTLGLLAVGGVFLVLWRQSQKAYNNREQHRITKGLVDMDNDYSGSGPRQPATPNLPAVLTSDMPRQVDEGWVERRVMQNLDLFRNSDSLLEAFLLNLRDHYHSKWELQMLDRVEQKLRKQISVMEAGATHAATRRTLWERTETEILQTRTTHENARQDYQKATARSAESVRLAELEAENMRLKAEKENRELKEALADKPDRAAAPAAAVNDPSSRARAKAAKIDELEAELAKALAGLDLESDRAKRLKRIYTDEINRVMQEE